VTVRIPGIIELQAGGSFPVEPDKSILLRPNLARGFAIHPQSIRVSPVLVGKNYANLFIKASFGKRVGQKHEVGVWECEGSDFVNAEDVLIEQRGFSGEFSSDQL